MSHSDMLQRMCHSALATTDLKAIVKSRGFPPSAANPGILTGLFLTEQGLAAAFKSLDRAEIGALHLLKAIGRPVKVSFFDRIYDGGRGRGYTFTQKYQGVWAKVKERLVRSGVLLMSDVPSRGGETKMELWRYALPAQFHPHLPPLLESFRTFDGPGDCRSGMVRDKLLADLGGAAAPAKNDGIPCFRIADGELRLGENRFQASQVARLQIALWNERLGSPKSKPSDEDAYYLAPPDAIYQLLTSLRESQWTDPDQLDDLARVFTGRKVDCHAACETGWQVGLLAKREAEGKTWYRPAPAEPVVAPHKYLEAVEGASCVATNLSLVPFRALETLAQLGDARPHPSGSPSLLWTPNLVRMGRAGDDVLASDEALWLFRHSQAFEKAHEVLVSRRGKTVVHSDVLIARVTDLSLKVALEKLLGGSLVSLQNDYVVFPRGALGDVQRLVRKSGHVIKEVSNHER